MYIRVVLLTALSLTNFLPRHAMASEPPLPLDVTITLQRGGCERRCAVYSLVIFGNGTGAFIGRYYVAKPGAVSLTVAEEAIRRLLAHADSAGFFGMRTDYGAQNLESCTSIDKNDAPIAILSISGNGRSNTVVHHHRCLGVDPQRLTELEDEVDSLAGAGKLIRGSLKPRENMGAGAHP